jgi:hypothetical protein
MIDFFIKNIYVVKSRKNEMGGACSMYGRKEVLLGKPEGNRPLRRPRRRLRWIFRKWDVGAWNGSS